MTKSQFTKLLANYKNINQKTKQKWIAVLPYLNNKQLSLLFNLLKNQQTKINRLSEIVINKINDIVYKISLLIKKHNKSDEAKERENEENIMNKLLEDLNKI